jgi:hypothetical protein
MGQLELQDDADILKNKHTANLGDATVTVQAELLREAMRYAITTQEWLLKKFRCLELVWCVIPLTPFHYFLGNIYHCHTFAVKYYLNNRI